MFDRSVQPEDTPEIRRGWYMPVIAGVRAITRQSITRPTRVVLAASAADVIRAQA